MPQRMWNSFSASCFCVSNYATFSSVWCNQLQCLCRHQELPVGLLTTGTHLSPQSIKGGVELCDLLGNFASQHQRASGFWRKFSVCRSGFKKQVVANSHSAKLSEFPPLPLSALPTESKGMHRMTYDNSLASGAD